MNNSNDRGRCAVSFAAIDPYIQQNIITPRETRLGGKDIVSWGDENRYPSYLLELYDNCPTLRSIVNGNVDFVAGNDVTVARPLFGRFMNRKGQSVRDIVKQMAKDYEIYGGFALQIIRDKRGIPAEIYALDLRFVRSNKENSVFYYCENFGKRSGNQKAIVYPAFIPGLEAEWPALTDEQRNAAASSVLFVKSVDTQVYPAPLYAASVKACEIERSIDDFHLNAINNSFTGSMVVNFNNGNPQDEIKDEIESDFMSKFSGHQNGGRVMFSWNRDKDAATTITTPEVKDFGARYDALAKHCRQQIFTAFRANPNLFGIPTESLGFSSEEYESAFKLYNRTQVQPVQRLIAEAFEKVYGESNVINIVPFCIEGDTEKAVN